MIPTRAGNKRLPREKPVVMATGPGHVWSWDITELYPPWRGRSFKAYSVRDIYSRQMVAWRVEEREADHLAVDMCETALHGVPRIVHADSGPAMRSHLLRNALTSHGVELSHNRPYISNDNPFSESGLRAPGSGLRAPEYRPGYPRVFKELDAARAYLADYVPWYNTQHKHTGIALFSPAEVHNGSWKEIWKTRDHALQRYHDQNPARFHQRPTTPAPAGNTGINLPATKPAKQPTQ